MAAKGLSRRPLARKCGFRSPEETQRILDLLLAEVKMLRARVDVLEAEVNWLRED